MDKTDKVIIIVSSVVIGLICVAGITAFVLDAQSPTFSLKKAEWECTEQHTDTQLRMQQAGNVTIPVFDNYEVCDNFRRIP